MPERPAASSEESPRVKLSASMVTDVGVVRDHNEDSAFVDGAKQFFIVADGMGGHAAGEVASAKAVDTVRKTLESSRARVVAFARKPTEDGRRELVQLLQNAVLAAHQAVFQRGSRESDKQGMGTTLDVLLVAGSEAFVAHVGDSRTYLIRDGRASQITTDHTVAEVLVIEGKLTIEEAQVSPLRTILVNAIGVSADVGVEMAHLQLRPGDRLLLCSDGLHDYFVAEQEIAEKLSNGEPHASLGEMVELAKERGGHDNPTGVVIDVLERTRGDSDGIPGAVAQDQTLPVDAKGWDDENTESLSVKEETFSRTRTLPATLFGSSLGIFSGEPERIQVEFEARTAMYVRSRQWHQSQQTEELPGGRLRLVLHVTQDWALRSWILGFGASARVVAPLELARSLADECADMERTYRAAANSGN
jgi:serine/threonine protein phosphatase PrpC